MELSNYVDLLASLAHESRLAIFRLLVSAGPVGITPGEISASISLPAPTLSFHLKELRNAGLIQQNKQGRSIHYSANYQSMDRLMRFLYKNCCSGSPCLPEK